MSENTDRPESTGEGIGKLITMDTVKVLREYLLGYKKNGRPRAIYDVIKDQTHSGSGHKSKKHKKADKFSLYIGPDKKKGKKGKKKKKSHWEY